MKKDQGYYDFVVYDVMSKVSDVTSRPMMSGWSIYSNGVPFAAIIGNKLYLKAKGEKAALLSERGWEKFSYEKSGGKVVSMSYWLVPEEIIDDQEAFDEILEEIL